MAFRQVAVLPDIHCPYEDKAVLSAVCDYLKDETWDDLIILGDFLDLESLSRFDGPPPPAYSDEIAAGAELLDKILAAARRKRKGCRAVLIEGNHEARVHPYMDKYPAMRGKLSIPKDLELRRRGVKWVPNYSEKAVYSIGNANFIHGQWVNKYHAFKHADVIGGYTYYGHGHDIQEHDKPVLADGKVAMAASLGCLCQIPQHYNGGQPTNWRHAFGLGFFHPDKTHQLMTVTIENGKFVGPTNKKIYGA